MPFFGPHVSYLDMITEAISNLRERSGSSEDSIAKFITEHYQGGTPRNFRRELKSNLKKYVESKELLKVKNSYKIPAKKETKKKETKKGGKKPKKERSANSYKIPAKKETKKGGKKPKKERSATKIFLELMRIQKELDKINKRTLEEIRKMNQKHEELVWEEEAEKGWETIRQKLWCMKRDKIIKRIPKFWSTAFLAEPSLRKLLNKEDEEIIMKYLKAVDVEDRLDVKSGFTITFKFEPNPFFENLSLSKKFSFSHKGIIDTTGTKIDWIGSGHSSNDVHQSFFTWFSDSLAKDEDRDMVAETIAYSLWPNAPVYYINATTTSVFMAGVPVSGSTTKIRHQKGALKLYDLPSNFMRWTKKQKLMHVHAEFEKAKEVVLGERWKLMEKYGLEAEEKEKVLRQQNRELYRSIYNRRNETIKDIPCFWLNAFFSHCALGDILSEKDRKIFKYLDSVNVEEAENPAHAYTITLNFDKQNPYFENASLRKTFSYHVKGVDTKGCTIKWKDNTGNKHEYPGDECNFFTWFSSRGDASEGNLDEVAELIVEDLWPNAIKYYINGNFDYEEEGDIIEECRLWAASNRR